MEYNSDANAQNTYVSNSSVTATGGTITEVGGYRIHTFTSNGTFTMNVSTNVEVLVVAGGGGGGKSVSEPSYAYQGGGGGGGLIYKSSFAVTAQAYTVTIGAGGAIKSNGVDSIFSTLTAIGGGYGGTGSGSGEGPTTGASGGSGGGGANTSPWSGPATGGSGTAGQGNNGGSGYFIGAAAGNGGGGAGSVGQTTPSSNAAAAGGGGLTLSISGSNITYAAGGKGVNNGSLGGAVEGAANTGDGGSSMMAGGSGIVIVRYPSPLLAYSEPTIKTQGSYAIKSSAPVTTSLNKTLTRTVSPTINLSDRTQIKFDIRSTRTGSNIKIGIRDSGGTTTYITPNITSANVYQTIDWDISGVSNANKDALDRIIIEIVNAAASNTFYIDNLFAPAIVPNAPVITSASSNSSDKITWSWQDNSLGAAQEDGFKIFSSTGGLIATLNPDTTYYIESGLKRNKEYSRYVQAYNTAGSSNSATITWRTKPGTFPSRTGDGSPARTGPNAFGFVGDAVWEWEVPVKSGSALTITAYIRYNSEYGGATKPKLTLSGKGISPTSISATSSAENSWELLTINPGTPSQNATLTLRAEGFSTNPNSRFYIDDINVSQ